MKEILMYRKETDNKIRWDADIDGTKFELYIPKWRIPKNIPEKIKVSIFYPPYLPNVYSVSPALASDDPKMLLLPIIVEVRRHSEKTKTVRYDPSEQSHPEIGSPYIPLQLLPEEQPGKVIMWVQWL